MATTNDKGGVTLDTKEATYVAVCVSLAQAIVLGETQYIGPVSQTLRRVMLNMTPAEIDSVSDELAKCAQKNSHLKTEMKMVKHTDLLNTNVVGAIEMPAAGTPKEEPNKKPNHNWN